MSIKKAVIAILLLVLIIVNVYGVNTNAEINKDYLSYALKSGKCTIEKIGLITNYKTNNIGKKECNYWLKSMNLHNKKITTDNNKNYCINFNDKNLSGYIESAKGTNDYNISIYVKLITSKNKINELKRKVMKPINFKGTCYIYIKAKSKIKSINEVDNNIKKFFNKNKVKNLKTTKINNILSTTMYTGKYDYIIDDGKKIDLNYAVCKYSDGNYVIIGTPILNINY